MNPGRDPAGLDIAARWCCQNPLTQWNARQTAGTGPRESGDRRTNGASCTSLGTLRRGIDNLPNKRRSENDSRYYNKTQPLLSKTSGPPYRCCEITPAQLDEACLLGKRLIAAQNRDKTIQLYDTIEDLLSTYSCAAFEKL